LIKLGPWYNPPIFKAVDQPTATSAELDSPSPDDEEFIEEGPDLIRVKKVDDRAVFKVDDRAVFRGVDLPTNENQHKTFSWLSQRRTIEDDVEDEMGG
jgi:hypothetical protein